MNAAVLLGGGLIGVGALALAVLYPRVILLVLVTLDVSNINSVIAVHIGTSPYLPQLAVAVVALLVMVRRRMFRFSWSPVLVGLLILFAGFCLTFVNAIDPVTAQSLLLSRVRDLVFFVVVFALMLSTDQIRPVVKAAVLVLAGLAALTVFHEFVLGNAGNLWGLSEVPLTQEGGALTPRHAGTSADVNFWARLLILFAPLSLSLLAVSRRLRSRLLWVGCVLALLLGVYLTQSRGGFIALFIGLVVWAFVAGGRARKSLLWVPLGLVVLVPLTGIGSRLATLAAVGSSTTANADPSVVTRERFQLDAWHMFLDAPFTGHGIGSYGALFPTYDRLANFYDPVTIVVAAHNFYLEQAADGGVLLLVAWVVFIGTVLFAAFRASSISRVTGNATFRFLAVGVIAGIVGWLIASVFLHLSDFRALLLVAAIAAALDVQSRRELQRTDPVAVPTATPKRTRAVFAGLVVVAVLCASGIVGVLATATDRYSNESTLAVVPSSTVVDPAVAYQLDVVSRGFIVPTLAEVLNQSLTVEALEQQAGRSYGTSEVAITVAQSRLGGGILVTVTAGDEQAANGLGAAAATVSKAVIADLQSGYQLTGAAAGADEVSSSRLLAVAALVLLLAAAAGFAVRLRPRRSGQPPVPVREPVTVS